MAASKAIQGIFLTVFTYSSLVLLSEAAPQWDPPTSKLVNQGETVELTCKVDHVEMFDIVRLFKKGDFDSYPISEENQVKEPFESTKRYSVDVKFQNDDPTSEISIVKITIENVQGEDAGMLGCKKLSEGDTPEAMVELKVLVPLKEVYIMRKFPNGSTVRTEEGETVTLIEEEEGGIACVSYVNGSTTPPNVRMVIDDEDKSSHFVHEPKQHVLDANGGLGKYSAETYMLYYTRDPDAAFNGKTVTCEASMEGFDTVSRSVNLVVKYTPVILCNKYEHWGKPGGEISLKCEVQSFPRANITWKWSFGTNNSHLESPGTLGDVEASEKDLEDQDRMEVTLKIGELKDEHFTQYFLSAKNDVDTKEVTITLHRGQTEGNPEENKPDKNPPYNNNPNPGQSVVGDEGGASSLTYTTLSLVHLLALIAILHLL